MTYYGMVWHTMGQYAIVYDGMVWYTMGQLWYDMAYYGTVCYSIR